MKRALCVGCLTHALLAFAVLAPAAEVTLELSGAPEITFVGAVSRWDDDGNAKRLVDPKAKIDEPRIDAKAVRESGSRWKFNDLPSGNYDFVILGKGRLRIEGFRYAPVNEFDSFVKPDAVVEDESRDAILGDIAGSKHYENKVTPLYLAGDEKVVRVLMMLIRDKQTSFEGDSPGAATIRHEIWQYSWNYGAWQKEKRTQVLDRTLLHRDELRKWTWLWDSKLGDVEIGSQPKTIKYELPSPSDRKLKGLYPY